MAAKGSALSRLPTVAKVGIGVGVVVLLAVGYFMVLYSDISAAIKKSESGAVALQQKLADAKKVETAYQTDLAELNERKQRQRELNKVLPESASYPAFLSALQGAANVSGVLLLGWTPAEESTHEFFAKVPMKLEIKGRFHQVAKFFYGVSQLDRIINIDEIKLAEPKGSGEEITIAVTCLATAFRSVTKPADAATPAPAVPVAPSAPAPRTGGH